MAKYRFDELESQADLDRLVREVKENSSNNYSQASERTQRKVENLESQVQRLTEELNIKDEEHAKILNEYDNQIKEYQESLDEAYAANDTYELSDMLNAAGIEPRFQDLVIKSGELNSGMEPEEFQSRIDGVLEQYPEFGLKDNSVLSENFDDRNPAEEEQQESQVFDYTKTNQ